MSFVSLPPAAEVEQLPEAETPIVNDGFFPDIDPAAVRESARIPTSITPARLRAAILGAIMRVEPDLRAFAADCVTAGSATLAAVPAPQLDGQSVQLIRYARAVALYTKAELIERHRDFDTTAAGGGQADELTPSVDDLRRDAQHAVRDIVGRSRTTVELI
ncbi:head completion/stabilization protein [Novosphingobium sp. P6W]|uniref:head completion/stabilization protein n=1 Tax=Novosphingobium sp. P6W TaxID=1609758 RepID=UPI0005C3025C|nr:head completion/stabilization protein [Novosphingobium sp. P6W]AXB75481.1 head completion/stabilization protein [Novosphingobium sp. P6W]KIS32495.1 head completion/stabilization protein [Novosphingobium sp. P6W]